MCDADLPPAAPSVWGSWGVTATVVLDPRNAPIGVPDAGEGTLRRVIDEWNSLADSAVSLRFGGRDEVVFGAADGVVAISWTPLDGGLAATFVQPGRFAEIVDADVALSPDQLWSVDGSVPGGIDLATVLRHELGHVVGLRHAPSAPTTSSVVAGSTMDGCLRYGELRHIDPSAAADVATRYPNRRPVVVDGCPGTTGPTLVAFQRRRALARPLAETDADGTTADPAVHARWGALPLAPLASPAAGAPAVVARPDGSCDVVVADVDGRVLRARWRAADTDAPPARWSVLGHEIAGGVGAATDGDGNLVVLAVGRDERLHARVRPSATDRWSAWTRFDNPVAAQGLTVATSPTGDSAGGVAVAWIDPSGSVSVGALHVGPAGGRDRPIVVELRHDGTVPGLLGVDRPALAPGPRGRWALFVRSADGTLHHTEQTREHGTWRPWRPLGGPPTSVGPAAGDGLVVATGGDGLTTLVSHRASGRPYGWTRLGNGSVTAPGAPANGP